MVGVPKHPSEGLSSGGLAFAPTALGTYQGIADKGSEYYDQGLEAQKRALGLTLSQAQGQGPSYAAQLARQQGEANARMGMALAARSRGGNLAGMQQAAMGATAGAQAQTTQDVAAIRAQEQLAAQQMYAQQANAMAAQGLGYDQLASQHLLGGTQLEQDWRLGSRELDITDAANKRNFWGGIAQAGIGAIGSMAGAALGSDERMKKNIEPSDGRASATLVRSRPSGFEYEEGMGRPGARYGIMAQGLEQTPEGRSIVTELPNGRKGVDIGGLASLTAASQAETIPRIDRLEQAILGQRGAGKGREMSGLATPPTRQRDTVATVSGGSRPSIDAQLAAEEEAYRMREAQRLMLERRARSNPFGYSGQTGLATGPSPVAFGTVGAGLTPYRATAIDPFGGR